MYTLLQFAIKCVLIFSLSLPIGILVLSARDVLADSSKKGKGK